MLAFMFLIVLLIILMLMELPVAFALGISSSIGYLIYVMQGPYRDFTTGLLAQRIVDGVDNFPLIAITLFMFAGKLMNEGGITDRIFDFAFTIVGRLRAGIAHVNIIASLIFSGMSGAAVADVAGLGSLEIKTMKKAGYGGPFSCAITGASSIIGPIIPPSIPMVVYGVLAGVSIGKLFLGGIVPGLLMSIFLMIAVSITAHFRGYPFGERTSFKEKLISLKRGFFPLLTPLIIIGGIWSGFFTPSEAAAVASLYAIVLCCLVYRTVTAQKLWEISKSAVIDSIALLFILACASFYSTILTLMRVPYTLSENLLTISTNPIMILIIINIFLLLMGFFIPAMVCINIFTPILVPLVVGVGIDPVFFGVLMVLNLMIGLLTPPYGMILFTLSKISDEPLEKIIKEMIPFIIALLGVVVLLIFFPILVTYVPNVLMRRF